MRATTPRFPNWDGIELIIKLNATPGQLTRQQLILFMLILINEGQTVDLDSIVQAGCHGKRSFAFEIRAENSPERMEDENIEFMLHCLEFQLKHFDPTNAGYHKIKRYWNKIAD